MEPLGMGPGGGFFGDGQGPAAVAGDWIKVENTTPDKPEVAAMADALGIDLDAVFGKLVRLWIWADEHTYSTLRKCNAAGVTEALIDRKTCVQGFAQAMREVGWLSVSVTGDVTFPRFDRHNGETAKTRALTAKRVAKHRKKALRKSNAASVTESLPKRYQRREEKSREEKSTKGINPLKPLGEIPATLDTEVFVSAWGDFIRHRTEIRKPLKETGVKEMLSKLEQWGVARAVAAIRHSIANGWQGIFEENSHGKPNAPRVGPGQSYDPSTAGRDETF